MIIGLFSLASPLRDSWKEFSVLQAPCETPGRNCPSCKPLARQPEGIFRLASPLRDSRKDISRLQAPCETPGMIFLVCKPLARLPEGFFSFASPLRDKNHPWGLLRRRAFFLFMALAFHRLYRINDYLFFLTFFLLDYFAKLC